MSELFGDRPFPRHALHAGAALIGLTILFAGLARTTDIGATRMPATPIFEKANLRFLDNVGGGVRVETEAGKTVASFVAGEGGFLRGVLRGFARDRRSRDVGPEPVFQLIRHTDGRLSLVDPESGRVVELDSFGPTNVGLFADLLKTARDMK